MKQEFKPGELRKLIRAYVKGDLRFVKGMLKKGVKPDVLVERVGARPLTAAVYGGHEKIVQFLLGNR